MTNGIGAYYGFSDPRALYSPSKNRTYVGDGAARKQIVTS